MKFSTVDNFLSEYASFRFDIRDFIIAGSISEDLRERWHNFCHHVEHPRPKAEVERQILKTVLEPTAPTFYTNRPTPNTFRDIPLLDKDILRENPHDVMDTSFRGFCWRKASSGTTGPPSSVLYSQIAYFENLHFTLRKIALFAGAKVGHPQRIFSATLMTNPTTPSQIFIDPLNAVGPSVRVSVDERNRNSVRDTVALLESLQPEIIAIKPSLFTALLGAGLESYSLCREAPVALVVSSGGMLSDDVRSAMEEVFHASVVNAYITTEADLVASESRCCRGLVVDTSTVHVEVLDGKGDPCPDGEIGEVVTSSLSNSAMRLFRYRTGDLGALTYTRCGCGRSSPRLEVLHGRRVSCFRFADGSTLDPTRLQYEMFARFPIREYQIVQTSLTSVELYVDLLREQPDEDTLMLLKQHLRNQLPPVVDQILVIPNLAKEHGVMLRHRSLV